MPFTTGTAQSILTSQLGKYFALLYSEPADSGAGLDEPTISETNGYARGVIAGWNTSKSKQVANNGIIFLFESRYDYGSFTHFALCTAASGGTVTYYGELLGSVNGNSGYVPLIRKNELIIGLDKDELEAY